MSKFGLPHLWAARKNSQERKQNFWSRLSEEVSEALENEAAIIIQMDGNLWASEEIVKGDPNKSNNNGKLFKNFLEKNPNLTVVNSLDICEGKITRRRVTRARPMSPSPYRVAATVQQTPLPLTFNTR